MFKFEDLNIRTKLAFAFLSLLVPLGITSLLTLYIFSLDMKKDAENELIHTVSLIYKLCESLETIEKKSSPEIRSLLHNTVAETIKNIRVGKTGYPYIMDLKGNLLIHPARQGENVYDQKDSDGKAFMREICDKVINLKSGEVGSIRYPWMNSQLGDQYPRFKILKYVHFKPWKWIIAAGSYESEIFKRVRQVRYLVFLMLGITVLLGLAQTVLLGRVLTRPIHELIIVTKKLAKGDLTQKVPIKRKDEIGGLADNFNIMAQQLKQYTGNLENIIQQRTSELFESERKYRTFVESSVDGLVTTDKKGYITFVNHAMEIMLSDDREKIIGKRIFEFYARGIDEAREIMAELKEKVRFYNREVSLIAKNSEIPILTSCSLLYDESQNIIGSLGTFKDISEYKILQNKLKKAQVQLVQTMKMRALGDLVAGVAHSINNPLMASNLILHVIEEDLNKDKEGNNLLKSKRFVILKECNRRIEAIVKHLKEFSRQSQGRFIPVDINKVLEDALLIAGQQLQNKNVLINRNMAEDLPMVLGDANQLEEVIMELIANSRDSLDSVSREKILTITTSLQTENDKKYAIVEVKDNGKGIPLEIRDKIFEPFFTTKEMGKGTGLGLSICYGIVEEHKGTMELESVIGEYAAFKVRLPVIES